MPGQADALREMATVTAVLGQMPGQRPAAFWVEVGHIVCERHGVRSLRGPSTEPPPDKDHCPLTTAELRVVRAVSNGLPIHTAAEYLFLSPNTVRNHLQRISARLGTTNTTHTVATALRQGWIG